MEDVWDTDRIFIQVPERILGEVKSFLDSTIAPADWQMTEKGFYDTVRLFRGKYDGYQKSRTPYHDLNHTLSVFLASARLMHGIGLNEGRIPSRPAALGLLAALFHDSGLILKEDEIGGTGAQFTAGHEERSIDFFSAYLRQFNLPRTVVEDCCSVILCTKLTDSIESHPFHSDRYRLLGRIVASADLIAQIADRWYPEKLRSLYREFVEAKIPGYESEWDLLSKTEAFYTNIARRRLDGDLGGVVDYMTDHFEARLNARRDFYRESMERNIGYVRRLVSKNRRNYPDRLRRSCPAE